MYWLVTAQLQPVTYTFIKQHIFLKSFSLRSGRVYFGLVPQRARFNSCWRRWTFLCTYPDITISAQRTDWSLDTFSLIALESETQTHSCSSEFWQDIRDYSGKTQVISPPYLCQVAVVSASPIRTRLFVRHQFSLLYHSFRTPLNRFRLLDSFNPEDYPWKLTTQHTSSGRYISIISIRSGRISKSVGVYLQYDNRYLSSSTG